MKLFILGILLAPILFSNSQASVLSSNKGGLTWKIVDDGKLCSYNSNLGQKLEQPEVGGACSKQGEQVTLFWGSQGYECNPSYFMTFECCAEGQCVPLSNRSDEEYP